MISAEATVIIPKYLDQNGKNFILRLMSIRLSDLKLVINSVIRMITAKRQSVIIVDFSIVKVSA